MNNTKEKAIMFGKAQCSAWVASAVDFGITLILTSFAGVWYGYSTFIGAVCGGITNCGINYRWVFHATGMKKKYMAMRYLFVWIGSIVLNTFGTWLLTELSGVNYIISKTIVAAFVAVFWNYHLQRTFVFRANHANE
ncbi:GtrA family protein [Leyella stercorea]|uniref:GtrA family protein n=1 Tax=Leyella stercorea TaxID=363265 RepID=UPI0026745FA5|nr:GtrA family protein [Leyella stercorea]